MKDRVIYVLDDSTSELHVIKEVLESSGYMVSVFSEVVSFYKSIISERVDLFVLDIVMPDINGIDVCKRIREISFHRETPILFLTATNSESEIIKGLNCGGNDYIIKPFNAEILKLRVNNLLMSPYNNKDLSQMIESPFIGIAHTIIKSTRGYGKVPVISYRNERFVELFNQIDSNVIDKVIYEIVPSLKKELSKESNFRKPGKIAITHEQNTFICHYFAPNDNDLVLHFLDISSEMNYRNIISFRRQLIDEYLVKYEEVDVERLLQRIGIFLSADRTYVFENDRPNDVSCSNTFEWCNDQTPSQKHLLQHIQYDAIPSWKEIMLKEDCLIAKNIVELPGDVFAILDHQGIKSIYVIPIYVNNKYFGFFGVDYCKTHHNLNHEEISLLKLIRNLLNQYFETRLKINNKELQINFLDTILNELSTAVVLINEDLKVFKYNTYASNYLPTICKDQSIGDLFNCNVLNNNTSAQCGATNSCSECDIRNWVTSLFSGDLNNNNSAIERVLINKSYGRFFVKIKAKNVIFNNERFVAISLEKTHNDNLLSNITFNSNVQSQSSSTILFINEDGSLKDINTNAVNLLQYSKDELLRLKVWDIRENITEEQWKNEWSILVSQGSFGTHTKLIKKDASDFETYLHHTFVNNGDSNYTISKLHDLRVNIDDKHQVSEHINNMNAIITNLTELAFIVHPISQGGVISDFELINSHPIIKDQLIKNENNANASFVEKVIAVEKDKIIRYLNESFHSQKMISYTTYSHDLYKYVEIKFCVLNNSQTAILVENCTDLQISQQKLEESNFNLKLATKGADIGIWRYNLNTNDLFIDNTYTQMLGYDKTDNFQPDINEFIDYIHKEDLRSIKKEYELAYATNLHSINIKIRLLTKQGRYKWFHILGNLDSFKNKKQSYLSGISINVHETKRLYEKLELSEKRYRLITNQISDLVWKCDLSYNFTFISPSVMQVLGYSVQEASNSNLIDVLHPDSYEKVKRRFDQKLLSIIRNEADGWTSEILELQINKNDGSLIWIQASGRLIKGKDGQPIEIIGVARDITDQVEARNKLIISEQKLIEEHLNKDRFISILGHDLSNLIGGNIQFADISKIDTLSESERALVTNSIINNSVTAYHLLNEILMWGKSSLGKLGFKPKMINMSNVINDSIEIYQGSITKKVIMVINNVSARVQLLADEDMLKSIVRNLLKNAIKFSHSKSKIIFSSSQSSDSTTLIVKDYGIGMKKPINKKVISNLDFEQSKGTNYEEGTGLGLMIVSEFVNRHKAELHIKSAPHKGTIVKITFPNQKRTSDY